MGKWSQRINDAQRKRADRRHQRAVRYWAARRPPSPDRDWWECARCGDRNKWRTNPQSCGGCSAAAGLAAI